MATDETATTKHIILTHTWPCSDSRPVGQSSGNIYRRTLANFCPSWFRSNHSSWSSPTAESDPLFMPLHDTILTRKNRPRRKVNKCSPLLHWTAR